MKKIVSVILSLLLIVSSVQIITINSFAEVPGNDPLVFGENTVQIKEDDFSDYYFTPSSNGWYEFYSTGSHDPKVFIYDGENEIAADDDSGSNYNFRCSLFLIAGKSYLVHIYSLDYTGDISLFVAEPTKFSITSVSSVVGGTVWVEKETGYPVTDAPEGAVLNLKNTADTNYMFNGYSVIDENNYSVSVSNGSFTMPACSVTVSASFTFVPSVNIGKNSVNVESNSYTLYYFAPSTSGNYRFCSNSKYKPTISIYDGETAITLTDNYSQGSVFDCYAFLDGGKPYIVKLYSNNGTGNISLYIGKAENYTITSASIGGHGTVSVFSKNNNQVSSLVCGEQFYIYAEPESGYYLDNYSITDSNGVPVSLITDSSYLRMYNDNIIITAEFRRIDEINNYGGQAKHWGSNTTWSVYSGILRITGDGNIQPGVKTSACNYYYPWFEYLGSIDEIIIESGVTNIPSYAFSSNNVNAYTYVIIGSDVSLIGSHAFSNSAIEGIVCPATVTTIETAAFDQCNSLANLYYGGAPAQVMAISIAASNDRLFSSTMNFNYALTCTQYDMNEDGFDNLCDVGFVIAASSQIIELNSSQLAKADLNGDGVFDAFDAAWLDRHFS